MMPSQAGDWVRSQMRMPAPNRVTQAPKTLPIWPNQ